MAIALDTHKIAYMPVPKAACSSVKAALSVLDPKTPAMLGDFRKDKMLVHKTYPTRRFRPHRWREYEGWWRFTVVRDPLKRLLSVYTDKVIGHKELHNSPRLRAQSLLPLDPDPDFFFQHLQRYAALVSNVKHHILPYRLFIGPPPFLYDRIYKIEHLPELAQKLSEISGEKVKIPHFNESFERLSVTDLMPQTLGFIREYLQDDYEKLSDFYTSPL